VQVGPEEILLSGSESSLKFLSVHNRFPPSSLRVVCGQTSGQAHPSREGCSRRVGRIAVATDTAAWQHVLAACQPTRVVSEERSETRALQTSLEAMIWTCNDVRSKCWLSGSCHSRERAYPPRADVLNACYCTVQTHGLARTETMRLLRRSSSSACQRRPMVLRVVEDNRHDRDQDEQVDTAGMPPAGPNPNRTATPRARREPWRHTLLKRVGADHIRLQAASDSQHFG
jgi:hypothetical protein